jgi:hypothetical protein
MFSSYIERRHKKKFVRNKCSKFLLMSFLKFSNCRKRHMAMQKKSIEKKDKCPRNLKQWVLRCLPYEKKREKKEKEKIAHVLWQKCFPSFKQERHVLKSIVELG